MIDVKFPPERVKRIRQALGLSQQALADRLGLHQATIAKWETGDRTLIDAEIVMKLIALEEETKAS